MSIDQALIVRKIKLIAEDFERLKKIAGKDFAAFMEDVMARDAAERYLERIVGRMVDINYHLVTVVNNVPPKDYFESFVVLGELHILPHGFADEFARFAGLRNRLAHEYDTIDYSILYVQIKELFDELPEYLNSIDTFVGSLLKQSR